MNYISHAEYFIICSYYKLFNGDDWKSYGGFSMILLLDLAVFAIPSFILFGIDICPPVFVVIALVALLLWGTRVRFLKWKAKSEKDAKLRDFGSSSLALFHIVFTISLWLGIQFLHDPLIHLLSKWCFRHSFCNRTQWMLYTNKL